MLFLWCQIIQMVVSSIAHSLERDLCLRDGYGTSVTNSCNRIFNIFHHFLSSGIRSGEQLLISCTKTWWTLSFFYDNVDYASVHWRTMKLLLDTEVDLRNFRLVSLRLHVQFAHPCSYPALLRTPDRFRR